LTSPKPIDEGETRWRTSTGKRHRDRTTEDAGDGRVHVGRSADRRSDGQRRHECGEGRSDPDVREAAHLDVDDCRRHEQGHRRGSRKRNCPDDRCDDQRRDRQCGGADDHPTL
jgi:hypothetical protein